MWSDDDLVVDPLSQMHVLATVCGLELQQTGWEDRIVTPEEWMEVAREQMADSSIRRAVDAIVAHDEVGEYRVVQRVDGDVEVRGPDTDMLLQGGVHAALFEVYGGEDQAAGDDGVLFAAPDGVAQVNEELYLLRFGESYLYSTAPRRMHPEVRYCAGSMQDGIDTVCRELRSYKGNVVVATPFDRVALWELGFGDRRGVHYYTSGSPPPPPLHEEEGEEQQQTCCLVVDDPVALQTLPLVPFPQHRIEVIQPGMTLRMPPPMPTRVSPDYYEAIAGTVDISLSSSVAFVQMRERLIRLAAADPSLKADRPRLCQVYRDVQSALCGGPAVTVGTPCADGPAVAECAICLADDGEEKRGIELPCGHAFHATCASTWVLQHRTCPMCRAPCKPQDVPGWTVTFDPDTERGGHIVSFALSERLDTEEDQLVVGPAELFQSVNLDVCAPCAVRDHGPTRCLRLPNGGGPPSIYLVGRNVFDALHREAIREVLKLHGIDIATDQVRLYQCGHYHTFEMTAYPADTFYHMMFDPEVESDEEL